MDAARAAGGAPPIAARTVAVLSGKGGVGKSSVSVQLALSLALAGKRVREAGDAATATKDTNWMQVGLLDVDLCGPSIARMLNVASERVTQGERGWRPVVVSDGQGHFLKTMSIAFLLPHSDDAVVWRGPKKSGMTPRSSSLPTDLAWIAMIQQFIHNVDWGELDYLIIDTPPGTSDEHIAIAELLPPLSSTGALIVTTPQLVALADVEREIGFCQQLGIPILGVVENMSGYQCPHCAHCSRLFSSQGGRLLAEKHQLPFLAQLPISPPLNALWESPDSRPLLDYPLKTPELSALLGRIISQLELV